MTQPQVARLELGELNPSIDILMRISSQRGIEFTIDVPPAGTGVRSMTTRAQIESIVGAFRVDDAELLVAAT